jgi:hypothetical protein
MVITIATTSRLFLHRSGNGLVPDQQHHWHANKNHTNVMLASVGENTFESLARSHPDVFAKHHKDLILLPDGRIVQRDKNDFSGK